MGNGLFSRPHRGKCFRSWTDITFSVFSLFPHADRGAPSIYFTSLLYCYMPPPPDSPPFLYEWRKPLIASTPPTPTSIPTLTLHLIYKAQHALFNMPPTCPLQKHWRVEERSYSPCSLRACTLANLKGLWVLNLEVQRLRFIASLVSSLL